MTIVPVKHSPVPLLGVVKGPAVRQQLFGHLMQSLEKTMWPNASAGSQGRDMAEHLPRRSEGGRQAPHSLLSADGASTTREVDIDPQLRVEDRIPESAEDCARVASRVRRFEIEPDGSRADLQPSPTEGDKSARQTFTFFPSSIIGLSVRGIAKTDYLYAAAGGKRGDVSVPLHEATVGVRPAPFVQLAMNEGRVSVFMQAPISSDTVALKRELLAELHRQGLACRRLTINGDISDFQMIKELDHAY